MSSKYKRPAGCTYPDCFKCELPDCRYNEMDESPHRAIDRVTGNKRKKDYRRNIDKELAKRHDM